MQLQDRHLEHAPGLGRDGQERAIGLLAFIAQGGQHHGHDLVIVIEHVDQARIQPAAHIPVGRALEFVVEAEAIEKAAQHGVVMRAEALELAEGIGNTGQRLAQILAQHGRIGHVVRHLAQAIHVVGKGEEPRRQIGHAPERLAHHGRAHHLAECPDMRQARGAIAGLEQHITLGGRRVLVAGHQLAGFLERPGPRRQSECSLVVHRLIFLQHNRRNLWAEARRVNRYRRPRSRRLPPAAPALRLLRWVISPATRSGPSCFICATSGCGPICMRASC